MQLLDVEMLMRGHKYLQASCYAHIKPYLLTSQTMVSSMEDRASLRTDRAANNILPKHVLCSKMS